MKAILRRFKHKTGIYLYLPLFFFSFLLLDFSFRTYHADAGSTAVFALSPLIFTLCWVLLFSALAFLLPGIAKKIVMTLLIALFAILQTAQAIIFNVSQAFLSFSDLAFAEDGFSFLSAAYFKLPFGLYFCIVLSLLLGLFAAYLAPRTQKYDWLMLGIVALATALSVSGLFWQNAKYNTDGSALQFRWTDTYTPGSAYSVYTEFTDSNECLMLCGSYHYTFRSIWVNLANRRDEALYSALDEYYSGRQTSETTNEMTGLFEGKNVICVMLESIDTWMLTEDFMPNLCAIQRKSINFENHFTPLFLSAGTFNTEFAFNCGYYLPSGGTTAKTYATNVYPQSIASLFTEKGYAANSYHGLDGKYYNRQVVHLQWGYENFFDREALGFSGSGKLDTSIMESYSQMVRSDKPFYSFLITYSAHGPYNERYASISNPHLKDAVEAVRKTKIISESDNDYDELVRTIAQVMETDEMVGKLVENMKADGHLRDTVLVFFTDHWSKYYSDDDFVMRLKGAEDENMLCKTPFFIYYAGLKKPMSVSKVTSSVDMLPTLANLFSLDFDTTYAMGADAFSDEGGYVVFKDYSWYDGIIYDKSSAEAEESKEILARREEVYRLLNASWDTVKCNYFAYLQEKESK